MFYKIRINYKSADMDKCDVFLSIHVYKDTKEYIHKGLLMQNIKSISVIQIFLLLILFTFQSVTLLSEETPETFSIVILPDTQYYAHYSENNYIFKNQTEWIVSNKDEYNIKHTIHVGDVTERNSTTQWEVANQAFKILDTANMPYSIAPGNHDYYPKIDAFKRESKLSTYFPTSRFSGTNWIGSYSEENLNTYSAFTHSKSDGEEIRVLILSLDFLPGKDVVTWANNLIKNKYQDHWVIISTHGYIYNNSGNYVRGHDKYNMIGCEGVNLWNELVSRHSNILMVVCGHASGFKRQFKTGNNGNTVIEQLVDFSGERLLGDTDGTKSGNGWLYLLEFDVTSNMLYSEPFTSEEGNSKVFKNGIPAFYKNGDIDTSLTLELDQDLSSPPEYNYTINTELFIDRMVNMDNDGNHNDPAIAANPGTGDFVVVWENDSNNNGVMDVFVRGFDRNGNETFSEKRVHSIGSGEQRNPAVAMNDNGNFVVAWQDDKDNNNVYQIMARVFDKNGNPACNNFTVNQISDGQQKYPSVAMSNSGNFVVAYQDDNDQDNIYEIRARGFNIYGKENIGDFRVNSNMNGQQYKPSVAMNPVYGDFVITWEDDSNENDWFEIKARGFDSYGNERISDFIVNSVGRGQQYQPDAAMDANSNFVITWQDDSNDNDWFEIKARGFYPNGNERIADYIVNSNGDGQQYSPTIAMQPNGQYVITWQDKSDLLDADDRQNGDNVYNITARGFNSSGQELFSDTTINSIDTFFYNKSGNYRYHWTPDIAIDNNGYYFVAFVDTPLEDEFDEVIVRNGKIE